MREFYCLLLVVLICKFIILILIKLGKSVVKFCNRFPFKRQQEAERVDCVWGSCNTKTPIRASVP